MALDNNSTGMISIEDIKVAFLELDIPYNELEQVIIDLDLK